MCTVTFIARKRGYLLGMNRDEKRSRPKGLPPGEIRIEGHRVIYPSEPNGGTWISLNDSGVTLALINWYSVSRRVTNNPVSRGIIIPSMNPAESSDLVEIAFSKLPLPRINPFRLIGIFPQSEEVLEWQWDLSQLVRKAHRWRSQQWISSGFDEPTAKTIRSQTFRQFLTQPSAGRSDWLQRLHASHTPESGPFSTCMHRSDAVTVSYTQISVSTSQASLEYISRSPCKTIDVLGPKVSQPRIVINVRPRSAATTSGRKPGKVAHWRSMSAVSGLLTTRGHYPRDPNQPTSAQEQGRLSITANLRPVKY